MLIELYDITNIEIEQIGIRCNMEHVITVANLQNESIYLTCKFNRQLT